MVLPEDIPKLYTAFAEWLSCLAVILAHRGFRKEEDWIRKIFALALGLVALSLIQTFCGLVSNALWLLGMLAALGVMLGLLKHMLSLSWKSAIYLLARTFLWAELTAALEWQLDRFYVPERWRNAVWYSLSFACIIYLCMMGLFMLIERTCKKEGEDALGFSVTGVQVVLLWAMTVIFFALSNLSYIEVPSPFRGSALTDVFSIRSLVDLAGVIMLEFLYIQKMEEVRRQESDAIQSVLYAQYQQFRQSQENIELINHKYHDLKHQIQVLRSEEDQGKRGQYLDEIEQGIRFYETEHKTGNPVLDTILTSKAQQCLKLGIQMHVVADGKLLGKIHVMDLATIFGNALDNAIEHEIQILEKERRMIRISVSQKGDMVCISMENVFEGSLKTDEAGLVTTKADKRYHGYGVKSIQYAAKKYHGFVHVGAEDGWFRLRILMPL